MTLLSYIIQEAREEYELTDFWSSFLGSAVFIVLFFSFLFFFFLFFFFFSLYLILSLISS